MQGLKGEDIVDDTVFVIKTHTPWCLPFTPKFFANKCICVVRNPLPVIISLITLFSLNNHNSVLPFEFETEYPEWWDWWVHYCADNMRRWYEYTLHDARLRKVPTLYVRYEDLVSAPEREMRDIMRFMLGVNDLTGTNAERRI